MEKAIRAVFLPVAIGLFALGPSLSDAGSRYKNVDDRSVEMAEYIVQHSPFAGEWRWTNRHGDIEIVIRPEGEELVGEITRGTGGSNDFTGPVSHLKVENNVLTFSSVTGSGYELKRDNTGKLIGTSWMGRIDITVAPVRK